MAQYNDMIITRQGTDLINRQIIGEKNLEITKLAVGTGTYTGEENLEEFEELLYPLENYEIHSAERKDGAVKIKAVVTNRTFNEDAILTEIGVYATDGNTEILYGIATATCPLQLPAYNGNFEYSVDFYVYFTVDNGVGLTIRDRTDIATKEIAGVVKASEEIQVESDGVMRITEKSKKEFLDKAKEFMEMKISDLIGGAPETLDTLKEIADAIEENETIVDALNEVIGKKVSTEDFNREMASLGKSVADGKALVARAISDKGVSTAADAVFAVLADNIRQMATNQYNAGVTAADGRAAPGTVNWQSGWDAGVAAADGRALPGSVNYQAGYNQGVADADNRANSNSANWQNGYTAGANAKHAELVNLQHSSLVSGSGSFGAWIGLWTITKDSFFPHVIYNTGTWQIVFNDIRGDRRIMLAVGYGDINQCISPASSHLTALWSI